MNGINIGASASQFVDQFAPSLPAGLAGAVTSATHGLSPDNVNTSAYKTGVTAQDLMDVLNGETDFYDNFREWITSIQGGQQDMNNLYSLMETIYAQEKADTRASKANEIERENAELAFLRQKELDKAAMDYNAEQAQISRDYQTEMANSAYQRAVADLKKAGLNPILAYSNGAAATPSGGSASFGGSSAKQASTFYAQTQRQQIDQQSKSSIMREYISAVSRLGSTAMSSVSGMLSKGLLGFLK